MLGFKHVSYEGGIATPLIIHYPAITKGQKGRLSNAPGYLIDIMPTLLEVSGATYPTEAKGQRIHPIEGKSLLPILTRGTRSPHEYMYWEHENMRAIRFGNWKAIGVIGAAWELYNLETDRSEKHDVASGHPDLVKRLDQQWGKWANTHYVFPKGTMKSDFSKEWNFFKTAD